MLNLSRDIWGKPGDVWGKKWHVQGCLGKSHGDVWGTTLGMSRNIWGNPKGCLGQKTGHIQVKTDMSGAKHWTCPGTSGITPGASGANHWAHLGLSREKPLRCPGQSTGHVWGCSWKIPGMSGGKH